MASLLAAMTSTRPGWHYAVRLLAACAADTPAADSTPADRATRPGPGLVDPLSERELDVLRLLATDLDGPDIARRLFVSVNTMRTHTKNIYAKLGVNSRRAAVRRAAELGLLSRNDNRHR
jgi:LuxR family maltose regulon positive regulatory protein